MIRPFLLSLVALLGLTACQTVPVPVQTEINDKIDFSAMKTFAILPLPKNIPGMDPGAVLRIAEPATKAAREAMIAKGYTEANASTKADVAILIHGKAVPKTDVTDWGFTPAYAGYRWRGAYGTGYGVYGSNVTVDQYTEGTLIIEAYEVKSKELAWVSWITGRTEEKTQEQGSRVSAAVSRILALYPAQGTTPMKAVEKK